MMRHCRLLLSGLLLLAAASCVHRTAEHTAFTAHRSFRLDNGIPVYVRVLEQSRTVSLVCALAGGKALVPPEQSGLDGMMLQLMAMESLGYSDERRRAILKRTSADISAVDGLDFNRYYLKTIDTYFDELFSLYTDLLLRPAFPEHLFREVRTTMINSYRSRLTDGYSRVSRAVNSVFFKDHPYQSHLFTPATLQSCTLEDVQALYRRAVRPGHMAFFAAGNVDCDDLYEKLNETFGSLPRHTIDENDVPPFAGSAVPLLVVDADPRQSRDVSYVRGNFPAIDYGHRDYWTLQLATRMLSDILGAELRTRNGLVYSVWANLHAKRAGYGSISLYRTSDPVKAAGLIEASLKILADGLCVSPYGTDSGNYVPVRAGLDFYKRSFSTQYYSGLQDSASIAQKMAASCMLTGDPSYYLSVMERVMAVTAGQIAEAVRTHLLGSVTCWAVSAHPDTAGRLKESHSAYAPAYTTVTLERE